MSMLRTCLLVLCLTLAGCVAPGPNETMEGDPGEGAPQAAAARDAACPVTSVDTAWALRVNTTYPAQQPDERVDFPPFHRGNATVRFGEAASVSEPLQSAGCAIFSVPDQTDRVSLYVEIPAGSECFWTGGGRYDLVPGITYVDVRLGTVCR